MQCLGNTFNPAKSGSKRGKRVDVTQRNYGSVKFTGSTYSDKVCVSQSWCANDFEFFVARTQEGVNGSRGLGKTLDGIMGMARPNVPPQFKYNR